MEKPGGTRRVSEFRTETGLCWLGDDGIVRVEASGRQQTLGDARDNCERVVALHGGKPVPMLIDMRNSQGVSSEAQRFYAGPNAVRLATRIAILGDSIVGKTFGNLYLALNKPSVPVRLFSERDAAMAWLTER